MNNRIILLIVVAIGLCGCIDEYKITDDQLLGSGKDILYIDGRILAGAMSYVYIEKPVPINSDKSANFVDDATVTIVGDNGYNSGSIFYNTDSYRYDIDTYDINPNAKYKIVVNYDGNTYESDFLTCETSPEIKNLYYIEDWRSNSLIFYVDADGNDVTHNFMWTFDEDYEVHATVNMLYTMHDNGYILQYEPSAFPELDKENMYNPYMYCWTHKKSKNINIYSTSKLTENVVKMHEVVRIKVSLRCFDHLYCMTLYQSSITDEAFRYYSTMKELTELTGSLFSPMPTEVKGNIHCINNPNKDPRGYATASSVTYKRLFISNEEIQLRREYPRDYIPGGQFHLNQELLNEGYVLWSSKLENRKPEDDRLYYPHACNCQKVSTKIKPEWWPNDLE